MFESYSGSIDDSFLSETLQPKTTPLFYKIEPKSLQFKKGTKASPLCRLPLIQSALEDILILVYPAVGQNPTT